jgi:hypothetical protein
MLWLYDRLRLVTIEQFQNKIQKPDTRISDVLQLSGLLAGDVKESRNDNPTRDLQMAAD